MLSGAISIEPYLCKDGSVGFAIVYFGGDVKFYDGNDWLNGSSFSDDEKRELQSIVDIHQWELPSKIDLSILETKYNEFLENTDPHKNTDSKIQNKQWTQYVLIDLNERIKGFLKKVYFFDDPDCYDVVSAFILSSYFRNQFNKLPYLVLSATSNAGKTLLLKSMKMVGYRAILTGDYSAASIKETVDKMDVSVLMDEVLSNIEDSMTRASDLRNFLLNAWERDSAVSYRLNNKGGYSDIRHFFTNIWMTLRGNDFNEDLRSRCIAFTLQMANGSFEPFDLSDVDDLPHEFNPLSIRTDLYALKIQTIIEMEKGIREKGVFFDSFMDMAKRHFKEVQGSAYLYELYNGIETGKRIANRTRDIANTLYSIGLASGSARAIIQKIIENENDLVTTKNEMIESVLALCLFDAIIERYQAYTGIVGTYQPIAYADFIRICKDVSTKEIRKKYANVRLEDGWQERDIENPHTIMAKFRLYRIPCKNGRQNLLFLNPADPNFLKNFKTTLETFGSEEHKEFFKNLGGL